MKCKHLKDLQEHCSDFALIINQLGFSETYDWLMIASSIKELDITWNRYDKTGQREWCRPSYESDISRENLIKVYVKELTIFNYIWGALEAFCNKFFTKTQIKKYGKVNCLRMFVNKNFNLPLYFIECEKNIFYMCLKETLKKDIFSLKAKVYESELDIVYELRNQFAHGTLNFPDEDVFFIKKIHPKYLFNMVRLSSRIVLFYLQSAIIYHVRGNIVYSFFNNLFENIDYDDYGDDNLPADYILSRIHLKKLPLQDKMLTLWGMKYFEMSHYDY